MMLEGLHLLAIDDPSVAALLVASLTVYALPPRRDLFAASPTAVEFARLMDSETGTQGFVRAVRVAVDRATRPPAHKGAR